MTKVTLTVGEYYWWRENKTKPNWELSKCIVKESIPTLRFFNGSTIPQNSFWGEALPANIKEPTETPLGLKG